MTRNAKTSITTRRAAFHWYNPQKTIIAVSYFEAAFFIRFEEIPTVSEQPLVERPPHRRPPCHNRHGDRRSGEPQSHKLCFDFRKCQLDLRRLRSAGSAFAAEIQGRRANGDCTQRGAGAPLLWHLEKLKCTHRNDMSRGCLYVFLFYPESALHLLCSDLFYDSGRIPDHHAVVRHILRHDSA